MTTDTPLVEANESLPTSVSKPGYSRGFVSTLIGGVAGIVGAFLAVKALERIGDVFVLPPDLSGLAFGQVPPPDVQAKLSAAVFSNQVRNGGVWMASVGAILGACFGITGLLPGTVRTSKLRMLSAVIASATISLAIAGVVGAWLDSVARRNMPADATSPSELAVLMTHSVVWLIAGLGIGTGVLLSGGNSCRKGLELVAIVGLAGMLGGCLFPIIAGIFLPAVNSSLPIPNGESLEGRVLWATLPSMLMGLAVGRNQ